MTLKMGLGRLVHRNCGIGGKRHKVIWKMGKKGTMVGKRGSAQVENGLNGALTLLEKGCKISGTTSWYKEGWVYILVH